MQSLHSKILKRYLRLMGQVFSNSYSSALMYRSNVVFFALFETVFLISNLTSVVLGVDLAGGTIAGWSKDEILFLNAFYGVSHQLFLCFFINGLFSLGWFVWSGRFDYVLLKPLHPLVALHAVTDFVVSNVPNLLINIVLLVYFGQKVLHEGLLSIPVLLVFMAASLFVRYALALLCITPAFFSEKLAATEDAYWSITLLGRYPVQIFSRVIQWVLTYVIPLSLIAAGPSATVLGKQSWKIGALQFAVGIFFLLSTLKIFRWSLRSYKSVNTGT